MDRFEYFALGEHLCAFPDDVEYADVLRMVEEGHDDIVIWDVYEHLAPQRIAQMIDDMRFALTLNFIPKEDKA